jgi:hypothetical protein
MAAATTSNTKTKATMPKALKRPNECSKERLVVTHPVFCRTLRLSDFTLGPIIVLAVDEKIRQMAPGPYMVGSRLDESIPSTILTLISVVCRLCHIGKRQSLRGHNIDKSNTLEVDNHECRGSLSMLENETRGRCLRFW